jgi:hypothetical protein
MHMLVVAPYTAFLTQDIRSYITGNGSDLRSHKLNKPRGHAASPHSNRFPKSIYPYSKNAPVLPFRSAVFLLS